MADPALLLGAAVVKTACKIWLKDNATAADAALTVADIIQSRVADAREQRRVRRLFEDLEERIADDVLKNLEFSTIPGNERDAAVLAVADTFDKAALSVRDLFAADLNADRLLAAVRVPGRRFTTTLSADATELYDRVLAGCCQYVVELADVLPGFPVGAFGELLTRQTELLRRVEDRFDALPVQFGGADRFEPAYLRLTAKQLDKVELFGVTVSDRVGSYPLSVAYVSLSIRAKHESYAAVEDALSGARRAFVRGEAGSGKTTLLQWLAVRAARREFDGPMASWNGCVPFFVRLRRYSGRDLPAPEDFPREVAGPIAHTMPLNWVHDLLTSGRALVLVDGVDELPADERRGAREWLRELVDAFPRARYVVTSRPAAAAENWLSRERFEALEIQPMTLSDLDAFVTHWHQALGDDGPRAALTEAIRTSGHLRALAVNPLMTALICALHLDRRGLLPDDRMELYSVALEMLLDRRDAERHIAASPVVISRADTMLVLEDLAYWLVRNGRSDVSRERVLDRLTTHLERLHRVAGTAEEVLTHLLDRSGLLRAPVEDRIDFVHKTFQEFLAARAAVAADDIGVLVQNAHDDQWREVVLMAVCHARPQQTDELLTGILDRPDCTPDNRGYVLQALAVGCIQYAPSLSPELRLRLETVATALLPPRNMTHAAALAGAGDLALELLPDKPSTSAAHAAATIRMAAAIGGDHALSVIAANARRKSRAVRDELERAWLKFDAAEFADKVIADLPMSDVVRLIDPSLLPAVAHLDIRTLTCRFSRGYGDVDYLDTQPRLASFYLRDPGLRDVSAVARHDRLRTFYIESGSGTADLAPLAECRSLRHLGLAYETLALAAITRITSLDLMERFDAAVVPRLLAPELRLTRFTARYVASERHLEWLMAAPQLAGLEFLSIQEGTTHTIAGIERWAPTMTAIALHARRLRDVSPLAGLPLLESAHLAETAVESLEFVRDLPVLRTLHIGGVRRQVPVPDLAPLRDHPSLRRLRIWGREDHPVDLSGLAGATGLEVVVSGGPRRKVIGFEKLSPSVTVRRTG